MKSVVRSILWAIAAFITEVAAQCDVNLNTIQLKEVNADIAQQRTYTICPGTQLNIGTLDPNDNNSLTGGFFFQARPNLHIQCGPDGLSANNCTVVGGTLQVDGTDWLGNTDPPFNFKLSGFTFREVERYNFWGNMPGSITFYDCIFRDNTKAIAPVLLDYSDSNSLQELAVAFIKCQFVFNVHFGEPANGALIVGNGIQNRLTLQNSIFADNDMLFNNTQPLRTSFLVETSGPIAAHNNCFQRNAVGVAPIASYVSDVVVSKNFGDNSTGFVCPFLAAFENSQQFEFYSPTCYSYDETNMCRADETRSPTISPTDHPSESPSASPTTAGPSMFPSEFPSLNPTITPRPTGTQPPTDYPSEAPSTSPSLPPSSSSKLQMTILALATIGLFVWML
mmetsp:Transcript_1923/g.3447  ORF Transcript_1923/g.3447 Transcript_1923/m.3447 type:complete len:394 (-) Transcript_1923:196-1377(-)